MDNTVDTEITPLLAVIQYNNYGGKFFSLQMLPIITGYLTSNEQHTCIPVPIYNHYASMIASSLIRYLFAVYSLNSDHFASTTSWQCLPSDVVLATDNRQYGCALFNKFTK